MATRGRFARDSTSLLVGTIVNGLFAYVFFALATRGLGTATAAPVALLWTYWGMATAVITFPVQHWIIRTLHASGEDAVAAALPRVTAMVGLIAVVAAGVAWLFDEQFFLRQGPVFPVLVGSVTLGSYFTGVVRGGLAGRARFGATAIAMAGDNILRVVLAIAVLATGGGVVGFGVALVAGALLGLVWPSGYRFGRGVGGGSTSLSLFGAVAAGSLLGQLILIGGPSALALLGGTALQVTMLFATLALFRAPYLLALGVANRVTGTLTDWVAAQHLGPIRRYQVAVAATTIAMSAVAALGAYAFGPAMVSAVFGSDAAPPGWAAAVVAAGNIYAVGNLALSLLVIADARGSLLTRAWMVASVVVGVTLVAMFGFPLRAVAWAFLAGEAAAFAMLLWSGWSLASSNAPDANAPSEVLEAPALT